MVVTASPSPISKGGRCPGSRNDHGEVRQKHAAVLKNSEKVLREKESHSWRRGGKGGGLFHWEQSCSGGTPKKGNEEEKAHGGMSHSRLKERNILRISGKKTDRRRRQEGWGIHRRLMTKHRRREVPHFAPCVGRLNSTTEKVYLNTRERQLMWGAVCFGKSLVKIRKFRRVCTRGLSREDQRESAEEEEKTEPPKYIVV